jgi:hypothetical protein
MRQVLILSQQPALLPSIWEALLSFLLPLQWSHAFIPLLSMDSYFETLADSPFPLLIGLSPQPDSPIDIASLVQRDWVVLDFDVGELHTPPSAPRLPPEMAERLTRSVGMAITARERERLGCLDLKLRGPEAEPFDKSSYQEIQAVFSSAVIGLLCAQQCRLEAFRNLSRDKVGER